MKKLFLLVPCLLGLLIVALVYTGKADSECDHYMYGTLIQDHDGFVRPRPDYAKAREVCERCAAQGNAEAQESLGILYAKGRLVERDYSKARLWWEKAAAQGHARAQYRLGVLFNEGRGVTRDYVKAREWYEKSAQGGDADAQFNLGLLYALGQGCVRDHEKAREWFEKAAGRHAVAVSDKLGVIYDGGLGEAKYNLGIMYANGLGVEQDYVKAREWFQKITDNQERGTEVGYAQYNLGVIYANGLGVERDDVKAQRWFENAAERGVEQAQYNLAILYAGKQDFEKALEWFDQAAMHLTGYETDIDGRARESATKLREQLSEATRTRIEDWAIEQENRERLGQKWRAIKLLPHMTGIYNAPI